VFEYSWNRLSDGERDAFMKLSVFRGGFTREAAQAVAGASLKTLTALVNKALVRRDPGSGRYEVHELLRQYAEQQLDKVPSESDKTYHTHCQYYADFMYQREADLKGRRQVGALNEIEVEFANVRAAWDWAVASKNYEAVNLSLDSLCLFCDMRSRFREGKELFWQAQEILASDPHDEALWGRVWVRWVEMWRLQENVREHYEEVRTQVERSLAIARKQADQREIAYCLWTLGILAFNAWDHAGALAPFEASLALYSDLDASFYWARVADFLAGSYGESGQFDLSMTLNLQSLDLRRSIGDKFGSASSLNNLLGEAIDTGKYTEAKSYLREMEAIYVETGSQAWLGRNKFFWAREAFIEGDFEKARTLAETAAEIAPASSAGGKWQAHVLLGLIAFIEGDYARGRRFLENVPMLMGGFASHVQAVGACGLEDYQTARRHLLIELLDPYTTHNAALITIALPIAAIIVAHEGAKEQAVELVAVAFTHPASATGWMEKWPLLTRLRADLETELGPEAFAAAWERGKARDLDATVQELLATL
jgi:tetratricopeptide (TPR) repeat protein